MRYCKLLICIICLAISLTACGGKVHLKMSTPERVPIGKIETGDPLHG